MAEREARDGRLGCQKLGSFITQSLTSQIGRAPFNLMSLKRKADTMLQFRCKPFLSDIDTPATHPGGEAAPHEASNVKQSLACMADPTSNAHFIECKIYCFTKDVSCDISLFNPCVTMTLEIGSFAGICAASKACRQCVNNCCAIAWLHISV